MVATAREPISRYVSGAMRTARVLVFPLSLLAIAVASGAACGSRTPLLGTFGEEAVVDASTPPPDASEPLPDANVPFDAPDEPVPCVPGRFNLELAAAQLMFVIDRSGSMALTLDGNVSRLQSSRWTVLHDALQQTIVPLDAELAMGAKFFPEVNAGQTTQDSCQTLPGVAIPPARGNANAILDVFEKTGPSGGTPTSEAVRLAADFVATTRGVARTMVLATDGAPNCNGSLDAQTCVCTSSVPTDCSQAPDGSYDCLDAQRTVSVIADIFDTRKIPVYVIGIGGEESQAYIQTLDDMAVAGGRPRVGAARKYYDAQTPADLSAALTTVRDSVAKCTYLTPSAPTNPDAISVQVNGTDVPRDTTHTNGWDWVDQAFGELQFFGPACTTASGSGTQVSGLVACTK